MDGEVQRTLKKSDTWNETANRYQYPQTPARLQMSLWPAGQASNAKGTIDWAGGEIDWDSEDIKKDGHYAATIGQVDVKCYDPPKDTKKTGSTSYLFTSDKAMVGDVEITGNSTVLGSLGATGLDMDLGSKNSSSSTSGSSSAAASDSVPTIKGGVGNMAHGNTTSSSGSSGSSSTSSSAGASTTTSDDFNQGAPNSGAPNQNERVLRGSFFAVLVAVVVLVTL